jgi:Flp pilus assembly protein TadB
MAPPERAAPQPGADGTTTGTDGSDVTPMSLVVFGVLIGLVVFAIAPFFVPVWLVAAVYAVLFVAGIVYDFDGRDRERRTSTLKMVLWWPLRPLFLAGWVGVYAAELFT